MSQNEKILVIGSNSFSGASFCAHALKAGAQVVGTSRSPEPEEALLPYKWGDHKNFSFHQIDLNHDLAQMDALLKSLQPDYVINFAAQGMVAQSWANPEHWFQTNVVAMVKLHEILRKHSCIKKFVHASTPEVYGSTSGLIREDAPFNPSTPYAVSKTACDLSLLTYHKAYGFPVAFTRSANVCGPGQPLYRIIPKTIYCVLTGKKLRLEGGGKSVRSFIHIDDISEGTLRVARSGKPGEAYHLATGLNQSIRELVEEICKQLNVKFEDSVEMAPARLGQDSAYLLDCTKARTQLGWTPVKTLADVIRESIEWTRKYFDAVQKLPADYIHKP